MAPSKLITVVGATGNQGGSVVDAFLNAPGWRVRGITRDSSSTKAQTLLARGVEVIVADMDDPSTLSPAFADSHTVFAVSDFWGIYFSSQVKPDQEQPRNEWAATCETEQLKSVIDAVAAIPTLERFILSSLSDATKWSKGKYTNVFHFDSKANAESYGREHHPDLWTKTSVFHAGFFISNLVWNPMSALTKNVDGIVQLTGNLDLDVKQPLIAAEEDTGPVVKAMVESPAGKSVIGHRSWMSLREFMQVFTAVTGMESEAIQLPKDQSKFAQSGELKLELEESMEYFNKVGYTGGDPSIIDPKDLSNPPQLATVEEYLRKQPWDTIFGN